MGGGQWSVCHKERQGVVEMRAARRLGSGMERMIFSNYPYFYDEEKYNQRKSRRAFSLLIFGQ